MTKAWFVRSLAIFALAGAICWMTGCGKEGSSSASGTGSQIKIAVIPKGTTHVFWKSVEAGAKKAGAELGVEVIWKGPLKEDDRAEQIKVVEQFVAEGVSGIVLAPLDFEALARPVTAAMDRKIPVVIFDSALKGETGKDFVSFVATNNKKGGQMAGEQLAKLLGGKGKVVMLRYSVGSASTDERETGFLEVMKANPGITILVDNRYGGATVASAKDEAMKLVDQLKQADGVFCPNESSTLGMLGALKDNSLTGKIKYVGFDATPALVDALKAGEIQALIAQDPTRMGYLGVKTCVAKLKGETVEPMVDTGVRLITTESLSDPEIRKFLNLEQRPMVAETAAPTRERLRMQGVRKRFGATIALAGVDLAVEAGQVMALVGENGAGKSTLMKVLSGAHLPDEGQMWVDRQPYSPRNPLDARRAGVAMIYQELSLAQHLTVMENILLGMEPTRGPLLVWGQIHQRASEAMAQLGRPDIPVDVPVSRLSIASQQMVEIARAIAVGCRVLVLDEPTSSLTKKDIVHLFDLVRRLKSQGQAIVYISHFLEEVKEISDQFTVLRDGSSVGGGKTADASTQQIISMMVGRNVDELYPRSTRRAGEMILEVNDIAGIAKPQAASLHLRRGEVLGIAGLVGAGRTELLRTVFGLNAVKRGTVKVAAHVGIHSPARRWAQGVGMVSEDRKIEGLALGLSIGDNLTLSKLNPFVTPTGQDRSSARWIDRLAIRCRSPRQAVGSLSGGNQQKVAIARLLHHDVDVLLLDEPTRGIDVGSKAQIYRIVDELACSGKAVLVVSSYLPELMGICDRIAVMCRGVLGPARAIDEVNEHAIMLEATGAGESE